MAPLSSRKSGIEPLGNVPWGTHICHFFDTEEDLVDLGVEFCAAGIEQRERCVWLISDPQRRASAAAGLHGLDVELIDEWEWYGEGFLDPANAAARLQGMLDGALERGLTGLRVCGCEAWHRARDWDGFQQYEAWLDQWVKGKPLVLLCSYPLAAVGAADVLEVVRNHHIAIAKRNGQWDVLHTPDTTQLHARNLQQAAIAALGQTAIRERDLSVVMNEAVELAARTLATGYGLVWQVAPEHDHLVQRARAGWDELPAEATIPLVSGTAVGYVVENEAPVIITDVRHDPRFDRSWLLREYNVVTMLSAAIRSREHAWGVLSVHSKTRRAFTEDDVGFLQSMANVLALAIERDEYERAERRKHEIAETALAKLHAIETITDTALAQMDLDELLSELLARLRQALQADQVVLLLLDEERHHFDVRAADGDWSERLLGQPAPITSPVSGRVMQEMRGMIFTDVPPFEAPEWQGWGARLGVQLKSAMSAPLIVRGKLIGTITVAALERRQFTDDELDLLRMVVDRVAPAIERGHLLEQIRASGKRLEQLSRRLLTVQEEERRRIAVELHDQLGQIYTAAKIKLDSVQRVLGDNGLAAQVGDAIEIVESAAGTVRDLALELRPAMLDDLGLAAALRWYADRFAGQTGLRVHLAIDEFPGLDPALATVCFRVAQESLTNAARHAHARNVWLDVHSSRGRVQLSVRDDGVGFSVAIARARAVRGESLGLLGMEERVSYTQGTLQVQSTPGAGTTITASVPLSKPDGL
jgi:signal transduction histidine kinase/putative methionine-R-sulfoxide reductase with GAF domain